MQYEFGSRTEAIQYAHEHNSKQLRSEGFVYAIRKGRNLKTFSGKKNIQTWIVEKRKR